MKLFIILIIMSFNTKTDGGLMLIISDGSYVDGTHRQSNKRINSIILKSKKENIFLIYDRGK